MYVSGSVHKWGCTLLCAAARVPSCVIFPENLPPLPLSALSALSALQSWGGRQDEGFTANVKLFLRAFKKNNFLIKNETTTFAARH